MSKTLPARDLVTALEAVHGGETVVSESPRRPRASPEVLALITQGKSNADIATLTYLAPNTSKSYLRRDDPGSAPPLQR